MSLKFTEPFLHVAITINRKVSPYVSADIKCLNFCGLGRFRNYGEVSLSSTTRRRDASCREVRIHSVIPTRRDHGK